MNLNFDNAINYHYGEFPPDNLNFGEFVFPLVGATDALARYDQMLKNLHNSEILLAPLRNQEAVISSRMEGTISTLDEILKFEADQDVNIGDHDRVRSEVIETILYSRVLKATQNALEEGYPFSQSLVKSIHQQLLSYGRGSSKSPGKYKSEQNYLADRLRKNVSFIPISPENLQNGMDELFNYIEHSDHPSIVKTGIAHLEFEALHPFLDGNGRIGRMLITLMLWQSEILSAPHFYLSSYLEENKEIYIDTMREVSRKGNWENWCGFFLKAVEEQAHRNLIIAETISGMYENMKGVFADLLSSKYSMQALDFVFSNPVFRNNKFTTRSGIPASTAARFTRVLVDNSVLKTVEEASGRRPALYSFEPLLELVRV
ncbi:MAG: Fic family protein [Anaerolineales bacterium]|jgi:Fic family protein